MAFNGNAFEYISVKEFGAKGDGITDDGPRFQRAVNVLANTGQGLWVPAGHYILQVGVDLIGLKNLNLVFEGALIEQQLVGGPFGPATCGFSGGPSAVGAFNPLTANALTGTSIIHVTNPVIAGARIGLTIDAVFTVGEQFVVQSVAGGGLIVTLDRPILADYPFATSGVQVLTNPMQNIHFEFNGSVMTGTGERFIEMVSAIDSSISDLVINDSAGFISDPAHCCSWDTYSLRCHYYRVQVLGPCGLAMESAEFCTAVDCQFEGRAGGTLGYLINDCIQCTIDGCQAFNAGTFGLGFSTSFGGGRGCIQCAVRGGSYTSCQEGINASAATETYIGDGVVASHNTNYGVHLSGSPATISNALITDNGQRGILILALGSAGPIAISDVDVSRNQGGLGGYGIESSSDVVATNIKCEAADTGLNIAVLHVLSGQFQLSNCEWRCAGSFAILFDSGRLDIINCNFKYTNAAGTGVLQNGGVLVIAQSRVSGPCATGISTVAGTLRVNAAVDLDGAVAPVTITPGAFYNRPQIVANGTTPVVVPWTDLKSTDRVMLTLLTANPAPPVLLGTPQVTYTPGASFTVTGTQTLDASTYDAVVG